MPGIQTPWTTRFQELCAYNQENGNCNVTHYCSKTKQGIPLGRWVKHQRKLHHEGKLSGERIAQLESIGFSWTGNKCELGWEKNFQKLVAYKQQHGDCYVPSRGYHDHSFSMWVRNLRTQNRRGDLRPEYKEKLDSIGFEFEQVNRAAIRGDARWEISYQKLKQHIGKVGTYEGLNEAATKGTPLEAMAKWCCTQRMRRCHPADSRAKEYKPLSNQQIQKLDKIGFPWKPSLVNDQKWNEMFRKTKQYKRIHGHCWIPNRYEADKFLGRWAATQRQHLKLGILRSDRKERLDSIGFIWQKRKSPDLDKSSNHDLVWMDSYHKLCEYNDKFGNCLVPCLYEDDRHLASWVSCQRAKYQQGRLRPNRQKLLDEIGFVYEVDISDPKKSTNQQHWEEMYQALLFFKEDHGHCRVPQSDDFEDRQLLKWVLTQRLVYSENRMLPNRREMLDSIGFVWSIRKTKKTPIAEAVKPGKK